jgi:hypothetical protein
MVSLVSCAVRKLKMPTEGARQSCASTDVNDVNTSCRAKEEEGGAESAGGTGAQAALMGVRRLWDAPHAEVQYSAITTAELSRQIFLLNMLLLSTLAGLGLIVACIAIPERESKRFTRLCRCDEWESEVGTSMLSTMWEVASRG